MPINTPETLRDDVLDRIVQIRPVGSRHRIEIDSARTPYHLTHAGVKAVNKILDGAPDDYSIEGARRERIPPGPASHVTTYAGRLEIPFGENTETIVRLVVDDVRSALAQPGCLARANSDTEGRSTSVGHDTKESIIGRRASSSWRHSEQVERCASKTGISLAERACSAYKDADSR